MIDPIGHVIGRVTHQYYFEDCCRVYPDGFIHLPTGLRLRASEADRRNFLNQVKFYGFVTQFVAGKSVLDAGCGSGYGCESFYKANATQVLGVDLSRSALRYARRHYHRAAQFRREKVTNLRSIRNGSFDVVVSSEVLEHVKEYGQERRAVQELKRVVKPSGLVVISTPNSELLRSHGFTYQELNTVLQEIFPNRLLIENALLPFDSDQKMAWEDRLRNGRTGLVISEELDVAETVVPDGARPVAKVGIPAGVLEWQGLRVDLSRLHNTHSWVVLAKNAGPLF